MPHEIGVSERLNWPVPVDIVRIRGPYENGAVQLGREDPRGVPHRELLVKVGYGVIDVTVPDEQDEPAPFQIEQHFDAITGPADPKRTNELYIFDDPVDHVAFRRLDSGLWTVSDNVPVTAKNLGSVQLFASRIGMGTFLTQQKRALAHGRVLPQPGPGV